MSRHSGKNTVNVRRLRRAIELSCCHEKCVRVTILGVEQALINAASEVAHERKAELTSAWCNLRLRRDGRQPLRICVDLMYCPASSLKPFAASVLSDTLNELVVRMRDRAKPKRPDPRGKAASAWPFVTLG
jgi:hypothetical protein